MLYHYYYNDTLNLKISQMGLLGYTALLLGCWGEVLSLSPALALALALALAC
jgi:hypothetical protein